MRTSMSASPEDAPTNKDVRSDSRREDVDRDKDNNKVMYGVDDVPSPPLIFLFGLQQAVMTIGGTISVPLIISDLICAPTDSQARATLISITMFMCGVATIIQCIFGIRLGIIQGGSHTFVAPIVAMMTIDRWKCTPEDGNEDVETWKDRMREIQGNLILASLTQLILGSTGLIGFLIKFIGPLTIAPTISLIALSLTDVTTSYCSPHWGIAILSMSLILICTLFLGRVKVPLPGLTESKGCHVVHLQIFQLFPVIFSISISWLFCLVLTEMNVFTSNSTEPSFLARTDAFASVIERAPWFYWPYPFQFGTPTIGGAGYIGLLAATISSIVESIGDYHAAARISSAPPPPPHAVNRGIAMEGFASIISGMVGAGHGTTSYSGNIGAIGITKVASRSAFITAGVILVICGVIGKFGAALSTIPKPIIGGTLIVLFGLVTSVGLSVVKFLNLESTRNLTILGVSLMLGLILPGYINDPENTDVIDTGNTELDQMIKVLLGTAMFVGGGVGCLLDNIVPGTLEERGMLKWRETAVDESENSIKGDNLDMYNLPLVTNCMKRTSCCSYVPFSPSFDKDITCTCCSYRKSSKKYTINKKSYENEISLDEISVTK